MLLPMGQKGQINIYTKYITYFLFYFNVGIKIFISLSILLLLLHIYYVEHNVFMSLYT